MPASRKHIIHVVTDRIAAVTVFPAIRDMVHASFPKCTALAAAMREQEPGYFVFTEVRALDATGATLGCIPFVAHALLSDGTHSSSIDPAERGSDADIIRTLCSDMNGEYVLNLTHQPRIMYLPDLLNVMPREIVEEIADISRYWANGPEVDNEEPATR